MKPSILKAHLISCHFTHVNDIHTSLVVKRTRFRAAGIPPSLGFLCEDKSALEVFYRVA